MLHSTAQHSTAEAGGKSTIRKFNELMGLEYPEGKPVLRDWDGGVSIVCRIANLERLHRREQHLGYHGLEMKAALLACAIPRGLTHDC